MINVYIGTFLAKKKKEKKDVYIGTKLKLPSLLEGQKCMNYCGGSLYSIFFLYFFPSFSHQLNGVRIRERPNSHKYHTVIQTTSCLILTTTFQFHNLV